MRNSWICAASVGDATVSVRMRTPTPCVACCDDSAEPRGVGKRAEGPDLTEVGDRLRAVGVVQPEDGRLREEVGRSPAGRMLRVAFDLRRTAFVALDEQPCAGAGKRHRGRVEERLARNEFLGLAHVRHQLLGRLARARADAGKRQRRAHQLQEAAAAHRVEPLGRVLRELAVQEFLELGRLGDRLEAAPVLAPARAFEPGAKRVDVGACRS